MSQVQRMGTEHASVNVGLRQVSFKDLNQLVAMVGPVGSGKSTLLKNDWGGSNLWLIELQRGDSVMQGMWKKSKAPCHQVGYVCTTVYFVFKK